MMCFFIVCFFYISLLYVFIGVSYSGLSLFVRIIMINHQENLLKAIELSQKSVNNGSSPFGAIIVDAIPPLMARLWLFVMLAKTLTPLICPVARFIPLVNPAPCA